MPRDPLNAKWLGISLSQARQECVAKVIEPERTDRIPTLVPIFVRRIQLLDCPAVLRINSRIRHVTVWISTREDPTGGRLTCPLMPHGEKRMNAGRQRKVPFCPFGLATWIMNVAETGP